MNPTQTALNLAQRGYYMLPLHTIIQGKCSCGNLSCQSPGKHPRTRNGVKDATREPAQIEAWNRLYPQCNYGVATGHISGILVVDVDNLDLARSMIKELPRTFTVKTGKGFHLYYAYPNKPVPNRVRIREHVDIRSDGGYVVAPGGRHVSGVMYEISDDIGLEAFPSQLVTEIVSFGKPDASYPPVSTHTYTQGARNDSLYRLGRSLRAKGASAESIRAALSAQNESVCNPPLSDTELAIIIKQSTTQTNRQDFTKNTVQNKSNKEPPFQIVEAADFVSKQIPPISWLLDAIIPAEGLTMLAAFQKTGKSTFLYPLLAAIARGEEFMGFDTKQVPVGLLAVEEPRSIIRDRLLTCGFSNENTSDTPFYIISGGIIASDEVFEALDQEIQQKGIKLIAVDTLATFLALENEDKNSEVIEALKPFKDLRDKHGCSFLLVHHTKKNHYGSHLKAHRGASAFGGYADQIITMSLLRSEKEDFDGKDSCYIGPRETKRLLEITGRSDESPEKLLIDYNLDTRTYKVLGDSLKTIKEIKMTRVWLALNGKPKTIQELCDATQIGEKSIRRYLSTMCKVGEAKEIRGDSDGGRPPLLYVRGPVSRKK